MTDKATWKSQDARLPEGLTSIRERATRLDRALRFRRISETSASAVVAALFIRAAVLEQDTLLRVSEGLIGLGAIAVGLIILLRREESPTEYSLSMTDFAHQHGQQLRRQSAMSKMVWAWYLGPLLPGAILLTVSSWLSDDTGWIAAEYPLAFTVLMVASFGLIVVLNKRMSAKLLEEAEEVDKMLGI